MIYFDIRIGEVYDFFSEPEKYGEIEPLGEALVVAPPRKKMPGENFVLLRRESDQEVICLGFFKYRVNALGLIAIRPYGVDQHQSDISSKILERHGF